MIMERERQKCPGCGHNRDQHSIAGCLHNGKCEYGCMKTYMDLSPRKPR
jgi:hypothetical protein